MTISMTAAGPFMLGSAVGWIVYYFMRRFPVFDPKTLAMTLAAVLAGPALKFISSISGGVDGHEIQSAYFLGLGAGFFLYAGYLGLLVFLSLVGKLPDGKFEFAAGCGAGISNEIDAFEMMMAVEKWQKGEMTDVELRAYVAALKITRKEYRELIAQARPRANADEKKHLDLIDEINLVDELPAERPLIPKRRKKKDAAPAG